MSITKEQAIDLFRLYYTKINPENTCPSDFDVCLENTLSPKGFPQINVFLKVGELELTRFVQGYRIGDLRRNQRQDLRESMVFYFVKHHMQDIQKTLS